MNSKKINKKAVKSANKKSEKVAKKANKPTKPTTKNENAYLKSRYNDLYRQAKADAYKGFSVIIEENAKTIYELERKIKYTTIYYVSAILILSICILILGR